MGTAFVDLRRDLELGDRGPGDLWPRAEVEDSGADSTLAITSLALCSKKLR